MAEKTIVWAKTGETSLVSDLEMSCVPSKPKYGDVDLVFNLKGYAGLCLADVDTNYLNFENRQIIGYEIARRWNVAGKLEAVSEEKTLPNSEQNYPMPPVKEPTEKNGFGRLYKEWCGEHRLNNSCKEVHDSAEAIEFAEYCVEYYKNHL